MLCTREIFHYLESEGVCFFTGVPDSLLQPFCAFIQEHVDAQKHVIAANEGNALAIATGIHLATGETPMVYLQNSGLGNLVNPLTSLTDPEVYGIPVILLIGWRGEPGIADEPQHIKQGRITPDLLDTLEIPYCLLPKEDSKAKAIFREAINCAKSKQSPYAILVRKNTFKNNSDIKKQNNIHELSREQAIDIILSSLASTDIFVSTTGMISREVFEYRSKNGQSHGNDFLTVGSMGHASSIALGIALAKPDLQVYCLDGDGSLFMHMGNMSVVGQIKPPNYKHIVLNNEAHDSVGGQPTAAPHTDFKKLAQATGYRYSYSVNTIQKLKNAIDHLKHRHGPTMLEIKVNKGHRNNLGRPTSSPQQNKINFTNQLSST